MNVAAWQNTAAFSFVPSENMLIRPSLGSHVE